MRDFEGVVERAAQRFRPCGRGPYHFARGKLGRDPVFALMLRQRLITDGARVVDIGCGQGVLGALLAEAEAAGPVAAARGWTLHGFDLRTRAVAHGARALADLGARVALKVADARNEPLPACSVAIILDVLHYLDRAGQENLLRRVRAALASDGTLLLRVSDAASGWRFRVTLVGDWLITFARGTLWPRFWCRTLNEWVELLERLGFAIATVPASEGTPFANVLLVCRRK
jgi:SAM-dependent methyltransferase